MRGRTWQNSYSFKSKSSGQKDYEQVQKILHGAEDCWEQLYQNAYPIVHVFARQNDWNSYGGRIYLNLALNAEADSMFGTVQHEAAHGKDSGNSENEKMDLCGQSPLVDTEILTKVKKTAGFI